MSKRQVRSSKVKERSLRSPSLGGSVVDDVEIVDERNSPSTTFRAGIPGVRPTVKRKAKISSDFHGPQPSRIENPESNIEKITTRSASGIKKKRVVPDNGEDSDNLETPSKKLHVRDHDEVVQKNEPRTPTRGNNKALKYSTSATRESNETILSSRGKGKSKAHTAFASEIHSDNQDDIDNLSDDWDEEAMNEAFKRSKQDDKSNIARAGGSKIEKDEEDLSDDPFVDVPSKNVMPTPPSKAKKVYLEDYDNFTVNVLPTDDESLFDQVQDSLLRRQYRGLPALRVGYLLSWSTDSPDVPQIPYSQWPTVTPDMNIGKDGLLMFFITFVKDGRFFNPSRCSPLDLIVREGYRGRRESFIGKRPAVAICTGYCMDSSLIRGKFNKSIGILFHGQEWERYCCFVNMIFDQKQMVAQLFNSALTFSTLPESISAPPKFQTAALSPLSGRRARINDTPTERERAALYFSDIVPVFDAREVSRDVGVDFDKLDGCFSRFDGEVPVGSCVAVGHSLSSYIGKKDDEEKLGTNVHLGTNVLFVVVLGTPFT